MNSKEDIIRIARSARPAEGVRKVDLYWDMWMSFEELDQYIADEVFTNDNGYLEYLKEDICMGEYASVEEYTSVGAPKWATGIVWYRI